MCDWLHILSNFCIILCLSKPLDTMLPGVYCSHTLWLDLNCKLFFIHSYFDLWQMCNNAIPLQDSVKEVFRQSASLNTCRWNASTCTSGIPGDSTHVKNTRMNFSHVWQKRVKQDHCDNANFPKFIKDRLSKLAVVICNRKTCGIDFRSYRSLDDRHWIFFFFKKAGML